MADFTFHALGNADQVRDLFEGIVWVTGQGDYALAAAFLVTAGFIVVLASGSVRADGRSAIPYFASAVLFWFACAVPTAGVVIEDNRSEAVTVVDNVPLGVAFTASVASALGLWLAEGYESAFVPVSSARFTRFGAVYPERVAEALKAAGPVTAEARSLLSAVASACIVPEVVTDAAKASAMVKSGDLWATVSAEGWVNPARAAALPDGSVAYCPAAMAKLAETLEKTELPALKRILGARLAPDWPDPAGVLAQSVPQAESLLLGVSRTLDASLRHAVLMTSVTEAAARAAGEGDPTLALAVGLAKAQGNLASEINYRTMAKIGADFLPKVRNSLEIVVIGLFPVVVLLALVSGHALGRVVKSWLMLLAALELWPCAASLVNFLMIERDAGVFEALIQAYGADSLEAAAVIRETGASAQAVAGALMMSVPMVCYMAVCGGTMAIGSMTAGLVAPAQSAAQSQGAALAAGNLAQGNVNLGNVSANNVSANKADASVRAAQASTVTTQSAWGVATRAEGGEVTGLARTGVNLGVSAAAGESFDRRQASDYASGHAGSTVESARLTDASSTTDATSARRAFSRALNEAVTESLSHGGAWSQTASSSAGRSVTDGADWARMDQVTEGTTVQSQGSWSAGLRLSPWTPQAVAGTAEDPASERSPSLMTGAAATPATLAALTSSAGKTAGKAPAAAAPGMPSVGVRGAVQASDAQTLIDQATGRTSAAGTMESREAQQIVKDAAARIAATHSDAAVRQTAADFVQSLSRQQTASFDRSASVTDSASATTSLGQSRAGRVATTVDESPDLMREAVRRFGSAEGALRALNAGPGRAALAADHQFAREGAAAAGESFGAGALASPAGHAADAVEGMQNRLVTDRLAFQETVQQTASAVRPAAEKARQAAEARPAGAAMTEAVLEKTADAIEGRQAAQAEETAFRRGLLLVAREAFRQDNASTNYALVNAFLAGVGYQNAGSLQQSMRERAASDPKLKSAITAAGAGASSELSSEDWSALVKAARGS